jgi:hypothetical protein
MAGHSRIRRAAAALPALAAIAGTLALAGCGGGDSSSSTTTAAVPPKAQSEKQMTTVIDTFYSDDNTAKCNTLSASALEKMGGLQPCLDNDAPATKTEHRIKSIEISGDTAKVHLVAGTTPVTFRMVFEDGAWKVQFPYPLPIQL